MYKFIKLYGKSYGLIVDNYYLKSGRSLKEKLKFRLSLANLFFKVNVNFDCIFVEFLGDNAYFTSLLNFKKKPIIVRCHRTELYEYWKKYGRRVQEAARKATIIICVSEAMKRRLLELMPWTKSKAIVVHNSIDPQRFYPINNKREKRSLIIGSLGKLIPRKGFIELVKVVGSLINRGFNIKLRIGGSGILKLYLEKLVSILCLESKVYIEGYIPEYRLNEWYNSLDLFVLNSKSEGMPTVILEAMASGLPVVATNVGGIPEVVDRRWTYNFGDTERLKELIIKIYNMPVEERRKIGYRNRLKVLAKFNIRINAKKILKIINNFINKEP